MKEKNQLFDLFDEYAYGENYAIAFSNFLDFFLVAFKWHETEEEKAGALQALQAHPKKDYAVALLNEIGNQSEGFHDPLGLLYEFKISKGQHGQFFTPGPVATFMAMITVNESIRPGGKICDPCCGSGRMLLAAAKINRHLLFYGADIDLLCCKMSLVNMLLHSLTSEIAHMDTLANVFYLGYKTGTILKDGYHYPFYKEFTDPEESYIWLRPNSKTATSKSALTTPFEPVRSGPIKGVQGTLFD